jgi:hypothetical protein
VQSNKIPYSDIFYLHLFHYSRNGLMARDSDPNATSNDAKDDLGAWADLHVWARQKEMDRCDGKKNV